MGIDEERVLKCCAHIILGIDNAADRRFRIAEQKIGVQKLLNISAGQKAFCSPSTSIHTLGQIALSELLSPSHAAQDRNWTGIREFIIQKIPELKNIRDNANADNEEELLLSSVLDEVVDTVQRQLEEMRYFYEEESITEETETELKHAPLTNLGAETKFAKLNNRLMVSGGTTSIDTRSRKDIVATNALLVDSSFTELSSDEKKKRWKWGRASENVKVARKLNKDLLKTIETNKRLALEKKKELKKKNAAKALRTLEKCKDHNGPITTRNIDILQNLTVNELLCEVAYLRNTIAPNIHQMRRVKGEDG